MGNTNTQSTYIWYYPFVALYTVLRSLDNFFIQLPESFLPYCTHKSKFSMIHWENP